MSSYRAWQFATEGNEYRLTLTERPASPPGPQEVLVRIGAVSLNYRDHINLRNLAGRAVDGRIATSDGAGDIVAVGSGVTAWKPGDRVAGCFFQDWADGPFRMLSHRHDLGGTLDGMLAEYVTLPAESVVAVPEGYTDEEAATLPCAAVTAWSALMRCGHLQPGQTVLTLGTGGVSIFALQLATAVGARVIVTSSSDEKLARAKALGAWATVNYRTTPDWDKEVWSLTDKRGVDHVIEVGGPGTLEKSLASVAPSGHLALIGVLTGFGPANTSLFPLVAKNARISGIYVGSRDDFENLNRFLDAHQIHPVIDHVFPFDQSPAAFDHLASGQHFGKVVVRVGG